MLAAIFAGSSGAGQLLGTTTLTYTGTDQAPAIPSGAEYALVYEWGGGGGGGHSGQTARGGPGAFVRSIIKISDTDTLTAKVGGGGLPMNAGADQGSSGGGRTDLLVNGVSAAIAGGGGGGVNANNGGAAGRDGTAGSAGQGGKATFGSTAPGGGTTTGTAAGGYKQGGSGGGTKAGGWPNGGAGIDSGTGGGGGGGDGLYGGGSGSTGYGSGGGGASLGDDVQSVANGSTTAPGATHTYYQAGIAVGGAPGQNGGNGLMVIEFYRGAPGALK
ncbi:MAG TPA: hypothetical protein VD860_17085 [Azospirillum sp.]|nr:hypothetical protein [Azospirillum sp.]